MLPTCQDSCLRAELTKHIAVKLGYNGLDYNGYSVNTDFSGPS